MKVIIIALALASLSCAAPQTRKIFHEHVEDFLDVILEEIEDDLSRLALEYVKYEEFWAATEYMSTNSFRELVAEMESLPEFNAVVEFLENDNIDIMYFIDRAHEIIDAISRMPRPTGELVSGPDFNSFISEVTALFPKAKLAALFDDKMANIEEFRVAIDNLRSSEWDRIFTALLNSPAFQAEVQTFRNNGIDLDLLIVEIVAVFGQN